MKTSLARFLLLCLGLRGFAVTAQSASYSNPVLPGDYPDPSVIRVGQEYWATATTSEWAPLFPLLRSTDLVHWEHVDNAFRRRPDWASANFWAPEISEHQGKFYIYYVGRKKSGPLSLAVATAEKPGGPWTDHGPFMSQPAGSIDGVTAIHENGKRWLLWKEDGNSRNLPTPIWAQELSDDGTRLVGEMKELFRNDAPWEKNLVEGPFVQKRGEYFYCFYSGNGCCGAGCNYALGVARAKSLVGPWEKHPRNPLLPGNDKWRCPGHGSIVSTPDGRDFLLYHAYHGKSFIYTGRQGLLDEVTWADGWPSINGGKGPSVTATAPIKFEPRELTQDFTDEFNDAKLRPEWQWPVNNEPTIRIKDGALILSVAPNRSRDLLGAVAGLKTMTGDYTAITVLDRAALEPGTQAGLSAFGDAQNALGILLGDDKLRVYRRQKGKHEVVATIPAPPGSRLHLRLAASEGHRFRFAYSTDGRTWENAGSAVDLEGNYLPPWDRGIRVALTVGGSEDAAGRFDSLSMHCLE
ncbi:MAG TPA: family 43 glycosylhydrolase [Verrucomicrobiae bacterium]|nr:family 43 glycosylhydrolase [Verrucomicrobiae bacterium]